MIHPIGKTITFWLLCSLASLSYAQLSVNVDRRQISEADVLKLTIQVTNPTGTINPDFSFLEKDFNIIGVSGPNRKSSTTFINGRNTSTSSIQWELSLHPKRLGRVIIPAFRLGNEVSKQITIQVVPQSAAQKQATERLVFFETSVDRKTTYVQGQVIYTVRLFYVDNISGDFPGAPAITNAVIETIENERRYDTLRNGQRYYVLEKSYAIYPQKSGTLTIPRQAFSGSKVGRGFFSTRESITRLSESHTISVQPKPAAFPGPDWLPARALQVTESWSEAPPVFIVGEPVNRTLKISADGLAASLLPPFDNFEIEGTKTYRDPPADDQQTSQTGIVSSRTTIIGIVPTRPGSITIPEIRIPWWNTETDSLELALIPAATYAVSASETEQPEIRTTPLVAPVTDALPADITNITDVARTSPFWMLIAASLAAGWLITLLLWQRQYHNSIGRPALETDTTRSSDTASELLSRLVAACRKNQPDTARNLLFLWGQARYPAAASSHELASKLGSEQLAAEIRQLESCLFSAKADANWNGNSLASIVMELNGQTTTKPKQTALVGTLNPV